MKISTAFIMALFLFLSCPAWAEGPSIAMLKQIIQAGGSLILDLGEHKYTVTQLQDLASSLKYQSTLTIKLGDSQLSPVQCAQIAKARPGQVIFWF